MSLAGTIQATGGGHFLTKTGPGILAFSALFHNAPTPSERRRKLFYFNHLRRVIS